MSATKLWYPHHIEKYRRKTGHLNIAEHGAYRLLMDAYWDMRGPLPADETRLRKLIRADPDEWNAVRDAVLAFFTLTDEGWRHEKIDENLAEAERLHEEKSKRLIKAREAKRLKAEQDKALSTEQSVALPSEQAPATYTHSHSQSHILTDTKSQDLGAASPLEKQKSRTGTRLPSEWRPPPDFLEFAISEGMTQQEAEREANIFRDYWIAQAGAKGRKADWFATWRNWVRRALERGGPGGARRDPPGKLDDLRDVLDQAKEFDRSERKSLRGDDREPERRAIGFG